MSFSENRLPRIGSAQGHPFPEHALAQFLVKLLPAARRPAALGKSAHLEDAHRVIERDRNHVVQPYHATGRIDTDTVDPDVSGGRKRGSGRARTHQSCVPKPAIDALT